MSRRQAQRTGNHLLGILETSGFEVLGAQASQVVDFQLPLFLRRIEFRQTLARRD
jgi:hypothetical protein